VTEYAAELGNEKVQRILTTFEEY